MNKSDINNLKDCINEELNNMLEIFNIDEIIAYCKVRYVITRSNHTGYPQIYMDKLKELKELKEKDMLPFR